MATSAPPINRFVLSGISLPLFLTLAHSTNDAFTSILAALLPSLQVRFSLSETVLALLVAMLSFSSSVLQPVFGAVADRYGKRLVAALGILTSSSLLSLIGVSPTVWLLFALLLLGGLGSAAFHPAGTSLVRSGSSGNKALFIAVFSAGGTVGLALGPVLVLFLANSYGFAFTPLLMAPGLVLGLLMLFLVPSQPRVPKAERPRFFDGALLRGPVGLLSLVGVMRALSFVTFINAVGLWLVKVHGAAPESGLISATLFAFSAASGLGGITAGWLGNWLSRRVLIVGSILVSLPALLVIFLLEPGSWLYFAAVAFAGAVTNAAVPLIIVSAQDLAPQATGAASGMTMGLTWGTAGVLYVAIGGLQEVVGIAPAMTVSYLFLLPAAALAFFVLTRYREALSS